MGKRSSKPGAMLRKHPTGIQGFDEIAGGGLPAERATIVIGAAGTGKTLFALQTLVNAARRGEPGIFVAFEENADSIVANAAAFDWNMSAVLGRELQIFNANITPDTLLSGDFQLSGLLTAVGAMAKRMRARWIAFDAIDVLLSLLDSPSARRRELFRVLAWLEQHALTCIITAKEDLHGLHGTVAQETISYTADCVVHLEHFTDTLVASRALRILKYRGSGHSENRVSYWMGPKGIEMEPPYVDKDRYPVSHDRVSSGVERMDAMLGKGFFRGSATLLTGAPGTSKTTLSGKFAEAACRRGERTVYMTLDESPQEIVRNLKSVNIDLAPYVASGRLVMRGIVPRERSADALSAEIRALLLTPKLRCAVIDPVSALKALGNDDQVLNVLYRIIQQCKMQGITLYMTSVITKGPAEVENADTNISTVADNWIHLSYLVHAGERNRALTIVKARGTGHSNQVRELLLGSQGVTLADVFMEEGEVLMGTLRTAKEWAMEQSRESLRQDAARKVIELETGTAELDNNIHTLQRELADRRRQLALLKRGNTALAKAREQRQEALLKSRGQDAVAKSRGSGHARVRKAGKAA